MTEEGQGYVWPFGLALCIPGGLGKGGDRACPVQGSVILWKGGQVRPANAWEGLPEVGGEHLLI